LELSIASRNLELSPELKSYIERKLGHFDRKLDTIMETQIEVSEEKTRSTQDRIIVTVRVNGSGVVLHSQERAESVLSAVDKASEAITKQLEHRKGKQKEKDKAGPSIRTDIPERPAPAPRRIFEEKTMELKPMSLKEARSQIDVLGYEYLLFQNTDTKAVNLLLRRPDGNLVLVRTEPE
jgi:putative sigma-54 modulation protein